MQKLKIIFYFLCDHINVLPTRKNACNFIGMNVKFIAYPSVNMYYNLVTFLIKIHDIGELEG